MVKIEWDIKLGFQDVLIRPKRSQMRSRKDVDLVRTYRFLHSDRVWTGVPVVAANMDTTGTFEMARAFAQQKCMVAVHKHYTLEQWAEFVNTEEKNNNAEIFNYVAVSSGTSNADFDKISQILSRHKQLSFICLDIANGYSEHFAEYIKRVRTAFPKHIIMAGNVVTQEMTEQLLLSGADIVKVGIGPGSVCTTRKKTGVGYPQLSAVLECADAAHGLGGLIVSDGGCTMPGDFGKAFGGGSDFVMAGGMFSGYDESGGDLIVCPSTGKQYKQFYGMSSEVAMQKHSGGVANYRASEGKAVLVPYKGNVTDGCLMTLLGGIRSTCTYVGAKSLKELSKRTTFIRVQQHHNIVFGDEKSEPSPMINQTQKDKEKNKTAAQQTASTSTSNDPNLPIFDPSKSYGNLGQALLGFLNQKSNGGNGNDGGGGSDAAMDYFNAMPPAMKKEYFEFVYQKEQQKLQTQQQGVKK
eukprot:CAMPEP_0202703086 /NCGR_PEP_ID=MMETSP1385-20130828/15979_1 /ASSEMBLY_ACC=CAM_ASM_000861 /TAXON_ID=933848 /ORGANISM="Elphidium margaritaceum" /LENGTH=466 /DNA_ID=CAMNT_0049360877 /DNA_START=22 /DNA_END=1422 /DNA_ORIENTATION=-